MKYTDTKQPLSTNSHNMLTHIDEVPLYTDRDKQILLALGEILMSHNAHSKFGISLLHKHYDLNSSEVVVETKSKIDKEFSISVFSSMDINTMSPSMWKFIKGNDAIRAIQWFKTQESDNFDSMNDNDLPLLVSLRNLMFKYNCSERFGVGLLHRVRALNKNEILTEHTDEETRHQEMKLSCQEIIDEQDNIQTLWSFEKNGNNKISYVCQLTCSWAVGHRQRHIRTGRPT